MEKNRLKVYAQAARRGFIQAVTERAYFYGLKEKSSAPCEVKGDFAIINGRAFPKQVDAQRRVLEERINHKGFTQAMEEIAYTWFNRFVAIRYMEIHGFLSHGYRVLSHPAGSSEPEIIDKAQYVELASLDKEEVIKLKMDGTKDEELYRLLLIAECNELNKVMPFLFERVADCTELLLPDNLLHSDSLIRKLISEIDEKDWQEVEIIGWLYQFYISEKKDEVIGKVVKSEDIPAATQLFTPNWIVKYLVQNSLGAQWIRTYPDSTLKNKMEYYIEPAEQSDKVKAQLKEITPITLNPEELTLLDPACGSGHILVEAYDLLKEIYLERGYRQRDIPELILTKNLFGLEIDDRAAQLAGFALMMKTRRDDRAIFNKGIQPNIVSIQEMSSDDAQQTVKDISTSKDAAKDIKDLLEISEHGKTFGSLIRIPDEVTQKIPAIENNLNDLAKSRDLFTQKAAELFMPFVQQTKLLSQKYDSVVANPPYMGSKGMNGLLKGFAKQQYPSTKSDLFAMFIERGFEFAKQDTGNNAMVTMQSWMFLSSYEKMRERMLASEAIRNMVHMSNGVMGIAFGTAATVWFNHSNLKYKGGFSYVDYSNLDDKGVPFEFPVKNNRLKNASSGDFKKIPGSPIAYWVSESLLNIFELPKLEQYAQSGGRCKTHGDELYLRYLWEVNKDDVGVHNKWCQIFKGGAYRKWYGNREILIKWTQEAKSHYAEYGGLTNPKFWELKGITWTIVTAKEEVSFRLKSEDSQYSSVSPTIFVRDTVNMESFLCLLNNVVADKVFKILNPTLALNVGNVLNLPVPNINNNINDIRSRGKTLINIAKTDWDSFETSWDFRNFPMLAEALKEKTVGESFANWEKSSADNFYKMKQFEEENNRFFIEAYGLQDELAPDVPEDEITLTRANKENDIKRLICYSVGCMMGRYSLDKPSLIYAHSGNVGFDSLQYKTFPADDDGIVPITEHEWFDDDAACRFFRFIETAWDKKGLDANLDFIAEAIGRKASESSREAIRRYFVNDFYKDHCQTYKKRPIYWLFTSGKEKAYQALVYLHRYNEGTLSRMRTEYVLPLQTKINRHIEHLEKDKDNAASTSAANKIQKEIDKLRKQKEELLQFDEKLRHFADMKISFDLDDGVKVNYGKFGDLLAEVKAVTGK